MAQLLLSQGTSDTLVFSVGTGRTLVGRSRHCGICVDSHRVSRHHCEIIGEGAHYRIIDTSTNGTRLNGAFLKPRISYSLADRDVIEIGPYSFTFVRSPERRRLQPTSDAPLDELAGDPSPTEESLGDLVGASAEIRGVFCKIRKVAPHRHAVLVTGESGTGKELVARALHAHGTHPEGPFVPVNAAGLADTLFESELFGHEKGAFTGAEARSPGAFQCEHGGTLFLDEIGEIRLELQAKLLRALESGEVRRVGGTVPERPDTRVVAATNRDLQAMCAEGTFRDDLFHRLAVITIRLPPLRERRDDIPGIARSLLAREHPGARLSSAAVDLLAQQDWPGNVRELRNVLVRAVIASDGAVVEPRHLELPAPLTRLRDPEAAELLSAYQQAGSQRKAARKLGIPLSTFRYRLAKHGLGPSDVR